MTSVEGGSRRRRTGYEARQRAVVNTAVGLFARQGYADTSIDDLVAATGLQRGGLYHYIESKQHLLLLAHEALIAPLLARAEQIVAADTDPEETLRALLQVWVAHVAAHRDHMVVFAEQRRLIESDPAWVEVRAARDRFGELLEQVLREGGRTGAFTVDDLAIVEMSILGIVNHMPQWLDPAGRLSPAVVADRCADLLLNGLLPR